MGMETANLNKSNFTNRDMMQGAKTARRFQHVVVAHTSDKTLAHATAKKITLDCPIHPREIQVASNMPGKC